MTWEEDTRTALVGSPTLGTYENPTVVDRLLEAVRVSMGEIDRRGIRDQVPTVGRDPDPNAVDPDKPQTVLEDLYQQVSLRWDFPGGRARTMAELAEQLQNNLTALARAESVITTGPLPPGVTVGELTWAANHHADNSREAGYDKNISKQSGAAAHSGPHDEEGSVPIVDAPYGMGRALKFTIPDQTVRLECYFPPGRKFSRQEVVWFGFSFALGPDFPTGATDFQLIWQAHSDDGGSPPYQLQVNHQELRLHDSKTVMPIERERRYDVVVKCDFPGQSASVWVDDVLRLDRFPRGNPPSPFYAKTGIYHQHNIPGLTIYHGVHRVGTGYGAVRPLP